MSVARAFPYLRYNPDAVGDPGVLLAPPYDVIDERERQRLVATSEFHSALIELPEQGDNTAAATTFREWIEQGVLEEEQGLAIIQQRYTGPDGVRRTRLGVACEIKLGTPGAAGADGVDIRPHERIHDAPRLQRLDLMRQTGANISPVFLVYHDPERLLNDLMSSVTDDEPDFTSIDPDGTQTAAWFVTDPSVGELFSEAVAPHPMLIADGHHRYAAAMAWREEARAGARPTLVGGTSTSRAEHTDSSGADGVLAVVSNSAEEGICVFPTHRIVTNVDRSFIDDFAVGSGAFDVQPMPGLEEAVAALEQLDCPGFVVYQPGRVELLSVTDPADIALATPGASEAFRRLDVVALHALLLEGGAVLTSHGGRVAYTRSLAEARDLVDSATEAGRQSIGFILRSVDVAAVHDVAAQGEVLPQKSTYFFPKVPTGVVFRSLDS